MKGRVRITREIIEAGKTSNGGWTKASLNHLGIRFPLRKGWIKRLVGRESSVAAVEGFLGHPLSMLPQPEPDEVPVEPPWLEIDYSRVGIRQAHLESRRLLRHLVVSAHRFSYWVRRSSGAEHEALERVRDRQRRLGIGRWAAPKRKGRAEARRLDAEFSRLVERDG